MLGAGKQSRSITSSCNDVEYVLNGRHRTHSHNPRLPLVSNGKGLSGVQFGL